MNSPLKTAAIAALVSLATCSMILIGLAVYKDGHQQEVKESYAQLAARLDIAFQAMEQLKRQQGDEQLGATNKIPDLRALYEDALATRITATANSFTLVRGTSGGTALASSTYPFIIDEGTATEEFVLADCTGTTCTNVTRGISLTTGTTTVSSLRFAHGRGASVKITDGPILLILNRILQGVDTFPNALAYESLSTTTIAALSDYTIPTKGYVDFVGSTGCSNASETVRGCAELATAAELSAGTSAGGTGARLVIPSSQATSSPNASTATGAVPISSGRYLSQNWLDLTQHFIFSSLFATNATNTNATTTGRFAIPYVLSSLLKTDSAGGVTAAVANTDYIAPSASGKLSAAGNTSTTTGIGTIVFTHGLGAAPGVIDIYASARCATAFLTESNGYATSTTIEYYAGLTRADTGNDCVETGTDGVIKLGACTSGTLTTNLVAEISAIDTTTFTLNVTDNDGTCSAKNIQWKATR